MRERPDPVAGPGQVMVDVAAIPLLWLDTARRSGKGRDGFPVEPPHVPGSGVAGTVITTGPGVDVGWIGRHVVSGTRETGSHTERVAVPAGGEMPAIVLDGVGGEIWPSGIRDHRRGRRVLRPRRRLGGLHRSTRTPHASAASPPVDLRRAVLPRGEQPPAARRARAGSRRPGRAVIGRTYPLEDAAEAHRQIEAREVIGKSLLLVNGDG